MKLIIIGGVAGGASAATRARRLSEEAEIVVLERGPDVSFANCGLPYHIGETIADRSKLIVVSPERLRRRFNLDVRVNSDAEQIDRVKKVVRVLDRATGRHYEEHYDKLILAPGAAPLRPPIPGVDTEGVFTLRTLGDMDRIKSAIDGAGRRAVVIGAGFIGLELVENFVARGIATVLVELQDQLLPVMDREMTTPLLQTLKDRGVEVVLADSAAAFSRSGRDLLVQLGSGRQLAVDFAVLGIGVRPESQLARDSGLDLGERGGIRVNEQLQTSDPDIYAVGDAIEVSDFVLGTPIQVPLAGPANRQGRIAADAAFGRSVRFRGCQGTAILGVFNQTLAITGATEKQLRRRGLPFQRIWIHPAHHAGYYPGAQQMTLKLTFDADSGRILGAQATGGLGVDKRIDVLSTAIQAKLTVFDLEEMELAYAPQFGSAKDPINMLGFVAAGVLRGDHPQIAPADLINRRDGNAPLLVDVRDPVEFSAGNIPDSINIPLDELRQRLAELPRDRPLVVYCRVGQRGYIATRILVQNGFDVRNLSGGFKSYLGDKGVQLA